MPKTKSDTPQTNPTDRTASESNPDPCLVLLLELQSLISSLESEYRHRLTERRSFEVLAARGPVGARDDFDSAALTARTGAQAIANTVVLLYEKPTKLIAARPGARRSELRKTAKKYGMEYPPPTNGSVQ